MAHGGSAAIAADRVHYLTDMAVNAAVLMALMLARLTVWHAVGNAAEDVIAALFTGSAKLTAH